MDSDETFKFFRDRKFRLSARCAFRIMTTVTALWLRHARLANFSRNLGRLKVFLIHCTIALNLAVAGARGAHSISGTLFCLNIVTYQYTCLKQSIENAHGVKFHN